MIHKTDKVLKGHTENINSVNFSYDDKYFVSASDDKLYFFI